MNNKRITAIIAAVALVGGVLVATATPDYIFISRADLMRLPTSGAAWDGVMAKANENATPNICDQDNKADINAMAAGIVYARTGNEAYKTKVITLINKAMASQRDNCYNAVLAIGRQLGGYVLAADFVGYRDPSFTNWLAMIMDREIGGHSRWHVLRFTAYDTANNWGTHALASVTATDIYLNRTADIEKDWKVFSSYGVPYGWPFNKTSDYNQQWSCIPTGSTGKLPIAINSPCVSNGVNLDGAPVEDSSRSAFGSYSSYIHESMQGFVAMAQLWERTGRPGWTVNNAQICRSLQFATRAGRLNDYSVDFSAAYMGNAFCGLNLPTKSPANNGRMFAFGDYLFSGSSVVVTPIPVTITKTATRTATGIPTVIRTAVPHTNTPTPTNTPQILTPVASPVVITVNGTPIICSLVIEIP